MGYGFSNYSAKNTVKAIDKNTLLDASLHMRPLKVLYRHKQFIGIFFYLLFSSFNTPIHAQSAKTGNWLIYVGNQAISKNWSVWTEVQHRNYNAIGDLQQLLLRGGLGYNLSENNNQLLLGYGYIDSRNYIAGSDSKAKTIEHRFFQQLISKQQFSRLLIQHRYRLEERFLPTTTRFRFRYLLGLNIPINHKTLDAKTIYVSAYNEFFLHSNSPRYDRNRLYGGLGYVLRKNLRIELGYLAQSLETSSRNQFQIILFNNLPLRK